MNLVTSASVKSKKTCVLRFETLILIFLNLYPDKVSIRNRHFLIVLTDLFVFKAICL